MCFSTTAVDHINRNILSQLTVFNIQCDTSELTSSGVFKLAPLCHNLREFCFTLADSCDVDVTAFTFLIQRNPQLIKLIVRSVKFKVATLLQYIINNKNNIAHLEFRGLIDMATPGYDSFCEPCSYTVQHVHNLLELIAKCAYNCPNLTYLAVKWGTNFIDCDNENERKYEVISYEVQKKTLSTNNIHHHHHHPTTGSERRVLTLGYPGVPLVKNRIFAKFMRTVNELNLKSLGSIDYDGCNHSHDFYAFLTPNKPLQQLDTLRIGVGIDRQNLPSVRALIQACTSLKKLIICGGVSADVYDVLGILTTDNNIISTVTHLEMCYGITFNMSLLLLAKNPQLMYCDFGYIEMTRKQRKQLIKLAKKRNLELGSMDEGYWLY